MNIVTYASANDNEPALLPHWSVRQKLNRVGSVQFRYCALYAPLFALKRSRLRGRGGERETTLRSKTAKQV